MPLKELPLEILPDNEREALDQKIREDANALKTLELARQERIAPHTADIAEFTKTIHALGILRKMKETYELCTTRCTQTFASQQDWAHAVLQLQEATWVFREALTRFEGLDIGFPVPSIDELQKKHDELKMKLTPATERYVVDSQEITKQTDALSRFEAARKKDDIALLVRTITEKARVLLTAHNTDSLKTERRSTGAHEQYSTVEAEMKEGHLSADIIFEKYSVPTWNDPKDYRWALSAGEPFYALTHKLTVEAVQAGDTIVPRTAGLIPWDEDTQTLLQAFLTELDAVLAEKPVLEAV